METTADELQELLAVFRREAAEQLDTLGAALEALADCPAEGLRDTIVTVLRTAHNMKGSARTVGEDDLSSTAHALEEALAPFRDATRAVPPDVLDRCLNLLGVLRRQTESIGGSTPAPAGNEPVVEEGASIRIDTERLDRLMARANDLSMWQAEIEAQLERWRAFGKSLDALLDTGQPSFEALADHGDRLKELLRSLRGQVRQHGYLVADLQQSMKRVRMQPVKRLVPFWRRTVQESAQFLQRRVGFSAAVGEVEIDRYLVEHLQDAMLHLLRNAVDHGIEPPAARAAAGKDSRGRVDVRAAQSGGAIQIEVSDDGRGIDPERVGAVAVERGVIDAAQASEMSPAAQRELLFHPSFSTAEAVSEISGRGVGLSVVRQNVERLGGRVEVAAVPLLGGTTFRLFMPLHLLSTAGLLVRASGVFYAIPTDDIEQVLVLEPDQIRTQRGALVGALPDGSAVPLAFLASLMSRPPIKRAERLLVLVIARGSRRLGVAVDALVREREYVTQRLPWNLTRVAGVNGTTVLEDGTVAVSIDVGALLELAREGRDEATATVAGERPEPQRFPRVLVVDDAMTARVLARNALAAAGYRVALAEDGVAAWRRLQEESFDLVVSDVEMPHMDGLELTRRIRTSESLRNLPVVLVTQLGEPEDVARGREAGANDYLIKGKLEQKSLLAAVSRLL